MTIVILGQRVLTLEIVVVGGELIFAGVIANGTTLVESFGPSKSGQVGEPSGEAALSLESEGVVAGIAMTIEGLNEPIGGKRGIAGEACARQWDPCAKRADSRRATVPAYVRRCRCSLLPAPCPCPVGAAR